jgi:hypothetical protein
MKDIIAIVIIMLFCITALARQGSPDGTIVPSNPDYKHRTGNQLSKPDSSAKKTLIKFTDSTRSFAPMSLQILLGSQGIGADYKYGYLPQLSFRVGFAIIPVSITDTYTLSSFPSSDNLSAKFTNVHLLADYLPFNNSPFRIVGGAGYILKGDANAVISPTTSQQYGYTVITKEQIGSLNARATWKGVAPYLGIALLDNFPRRLFNINLDVGTYYLSGPHTTLSGTKLLSDNYTQQPQFNKNMQSYRWLPVVQINFNFKINSKHHENY